MTKSYASLQVKLVKTTVSSVTSQNCAEILNFSPKTKYKKVNIIETEDAQSTCKHKGNKIRNYNLQYDSK